MIVNTKDMLIKAKKEGYAVPQFNTNNLEWTKYILEECNALKSPVIIGVSEGTVKYMGGYRTITNLVKNLMIDLNITIPVAINLDHAETVDACKKAIDAGFTSVMIDTSALPIEENILVTSEVVEYAKSRNVSVEAEVGQDGGIEDGKEVEKIYANIDDCIKISDETGIDSLAPALGSVHGFYKGEPKFDFELMSEISNLTKLPLVLHGGSGIDGNKIKTAIMCGVAKININTDLQYEWLNSVKEFIKTNPDVYHPRKIIGSGEESIKKVIREKIKLFGSEGKAQ